jgi:hypothetical protein
MPELPRLDARPFDEGVPVDPTHAVRMTLRRFELLGR